uniref:Uncharacterized protein n=1 Tax=Arion vulgaris TaxID=1028688 RepID=A0A0B7AS48_9EUPU
MSSSHIIHSQTNIKAEQQAFQQKDLNPPSYKDQIQEIKQLWSTLFSILHYSQSDRQENKQKCPGVHEL